MNIDKSIEVFFRFLKVAALVVVLGLIFGFYHLSYPDVDFTMIAMIILLAMWFEKYWLQDCKEMIVSTDKKARR